jgi:GNAT superfamily N-acetyltransferase
VAGRHAQSAGVCFALTMAVECVVAVGPEYAHAASALLNEVWRPPALAYSPEYLQWQLSFPSENPAVSVMAFDGATPVGFAGATPRRMRHGAEHLDAYVVSFVCVREAMQGRGIAANLYEVLLGELAKRGATVVTFALTGSAGDRVLRKAYPAAGFEVRPLAMCPVYASMATATPASTGWTIEGEGSFDDLERVLDTCARDEKMLWSAPTRPQFQHYCAAPSDRKLLFARALETSEVAAAWAIRTAIRNPGGGQDVVTSIACVFGPRERPDVLPEFVRHAAALWPSSTPRPVITAPSLSGYDPAVLRQYGFRQTPSSFQAYCCGARLRTLSQLQASNVEVI